VVQEYRLIGYENRLLRREDFNNDKVDAGEIGAGANVTALYELTLKDSGSAQIDPLRYAPAPLPEGKRDELGLLRLRYKRPEQDTSRLIERPIAAREIASAPSERLRFAAAVGAFADVLRGGTHAGDFDLARIATLAEGARGNDISGYRSEFVRLVRSAQALKTPASASTAAIAR
jgi:Ca-activated chloride channel family protein